MKTIYVRTLSVGIATLLTFAASAGAQTEPSALLNTFEVQQFVARGQPDDYGRLAGHFTVLAERYAAEGSRHEAMSNASAANANRGAAAASMHCTSLALQNARSAETVRGLAVYYEALGAGIVSMPPAAGTRFEAGEGAAEPARQELNILAARARTPSEHGALDEYFRAVANTYTMDADRHAAMARIYQGSRIAQAAAHCDRRVTVSLESANKANAEAAMHRGFAGITD